MARARRPHLPGAPFHVTARLQGRVPWFEGLQPTTIRWIREYGARAGCDLLALAVMPNHIHLVVVQGAKPLSELMQPLLRRLALLIHAEHRCEGHVFQRRYHAVPCADPQYLRNAIAYVHLNPVRAGLCSVPGQYSWTTHAEYCAMPRRGFEPEKGAAAALRLFAPEAAAPWGSMIENYRSFLDWRMFADSCTRKQGRRRPPDPPPSPGTAGGDLYWLDRFGFNCVEASERALSRCPRTDLRDLALKLLREIDPPMSLELLRSGARTRPLVAVRRRFASRAKENGHRNRAIARFLNISDVTVSCS